MRKLLIEIESGILLFSCLKDFYDKEIEIFDKIKSKVLC